MLANVFRILNLSYVVFVSSFGGALFFLFCICVLCRITKNTLQMAPARLIHRRQQDILLGFLEENKELLNGMVGNANTQENVKQKWAAIARQLNAVDTGLVKNPNDWKKYWFLWRHRCIKKASIARQIESGPNKLAPFTDQDMRLLKLCGKPSLIETDSNSLHQECTEKCEDMEFQPIKTIKVRAFPVTRVRPGSFARFSRARAVQNRDSSTGKSNSYVYFMLIKACFHYVSIANRLDD